MNLIIVMTLLLYIIMYLSFQGRYDLNLPEMKCEKCHATWTAGVGDLVKSDYWPAAQHFSTIYCTDVFSSYEDIKMAAPGLSCQAFLRMLDQRTIRFGRVGILVTIEMYCLYIVYVFV